MSGSQSLRPSRFAWAIPPGPSGRAHDCRPDLFLRGLGYSLCWSFDVFNPFPLIPGAAAIHLSVISLPGRVVEKFVHDSFRRRDLANFQRIFAQALDAPPE